jgi:hypothetical protein
LVQQGCWQAQRMQCHHGSALGTCRERACLHHQGCR